MAAQQSGCKAVGIVACEFREKPGDRDRGCQWKGWAQFVHTLIWTSYVLYDEVSRLAPNASLVEKEW